MIPSLKNFEEFKTYCVKQGCLNGVRPGHEEQYLQYVWSTYHNESNQKQLLQKNSQSVIINTTYATARHVDEHFNIVKVDDTKCGFLLLSTSTRLGYELLNSEPTQVLDQNVNCSQLPTFDWELGLIENLNTSCLGVSKFNKLLVINSKEIVELNKHFQSVQDQNERRVISALKKATQCPIKVLQLPYLISNTNGKFSEILPDPVNGLVLTPVKGSSTFIFTKSYYEKFDNFTQEALFKLGIKSKAVWGQWYSGNGGNLHCGSNTIPVCRMIAK
jgi:hypothetical protein